MIDKLVVEYYRSLNYDNAKELIYRLKESSFKEIRALIMGLDQKAITTYNIPQYSSFENGTSRMIEYLRKSGDFGPSFSEVGQHFLESEHKEGAYVKYGENHSKLAELLGLVEIKAEDRRRVYLTDIGREVEKLELCQQKSIFAKLSVNIPIVQYAIKMGFNSSKELESILTQYLSTKTAIRRRRNTWDLIMMIQGSVNDGV